VNLSLVGRLLPHQGCVIKPIGEEIEITGAAMNWVMAAAVAPFVCRPPFIFRIVGKADSTNLRMHFRRGELIFNRECRVHELRVHDPAASEQHGVSDRGSSSPTSGMKSSGRSRLDRMRVVVDREVRFETKGDYSSIASTPSAGPCFGSTVSVRKFNFTPLQDDSDSGA
jgi:hypothetical protein